MSTPAFEPHDHHRCVHTALAEAETLARQRGLRLTPVRRRALEILLERHGAMGAYDVLQRLSEDGFGHQPPVAYRALEFLVENGLAHRIRRLNAFAACAHPGRDHSAAFLICRGCDAVAEIPADPLRDVLQSGAEGHGFQVERATIEALGLCALCQTGAAP
ncbi:MAG: transcriptional repressor [Rhodobacter sp.]|uniref:Fur family transcriptional regulator n=1 Tax=Pararhodobacter sp. TaxID=2127056 RepID=UPI001D86AF4B|nr:Fur family transcriptional regulator [Pararhodobacter sp.]MCB1345551.1 transcriptional repressor [Paracoccaceae bacterium]MCC0071804.1 transcriptional repressor [Rhodobacter sp.]HPD91092.1 Fur family transcriptional regulator [Pararhodobacter sp.]